MGKPTGIAVFQCGIEGFIITIECGILHVPAAVKDSQIVIYADVFFQIGYLTV